MAGNSKHKSIPRNMILNPAHRADFDTNGRRAALLVEVRRDARRLSITFDDIRAAVSQLRDLKDGEIATIARSAGLEVIG